MNDAVPVQDEARRQNREDPSTYTSISAFDRGGCDKGSQGGRSSLLGSSSNFTRIAFIYGLHDRGSGEVRYVGKTIDLRTRLSEHKRGRSGIALRARRWILESEEVQMRCLAIVPEDNWEWAEKSWIRALKIAGHRILNIAEGGNAPPTSEEVEKTRLESMKLTRSTPQYKERNRRTHSTPEYRSLFSTTGFSEKQRRATIALFEDPEYVKKQRSALKASQETEEWRKANAASHSTTEFIEGQKKRAQDQWKDLEARKAHSEKLKAFWRRKKAA